jgi:hypothetical protein
VLRVLGPSQASAQRRAAKEAQSLREKAVKDALVEIRLLISREEEARWLKVQLWNLGERDVTLRITEAVIAVQELQERLRAFNDSFYLNLTNLQRAGTRETLAKFELECRDFMVDIGESAKGLIPRLNALIAEASEQLANARR